jgi:putative ABC transport system permease protein
MQIGLLGTWVQKEVSVPDGTTYVTGIENTNPWWHVEGRWFANDKPECVLGAKLAKRLGFSIGSQLSTLEEQEGTDIANSRQLLVVGLLETGGPENDAMVAPIAIAQQIAGKAGQYRRLYVSALTKPEDDFGRRDPKTLAPADYERWYCTPYISSIALQITQVLPGADVRVIRRVADGEGAILTRVRTLLWLVTFASLLAAALAVGASSAASVIERRTEIGLMKALGAGSGTVGFLLAAEQLLLALVGGAVGYSLGIWLARLVGQKIFGVAPEFSFLVLAVIIGLAAIVTLLGSAIPLRRASRFEPAPILRGE